MKTKPVPYGQPIFFKGKYEPDDDYPLFIQQIYCEFKLKKNKIPTIMKKSNGLYAGNKYLTDSGETGMCLTLTCIDLERFFKNYDINMESLRYLSGWKFKSMKGIFNKYIDTWANIKNYATKHKVAYLRTIAKLMLNRTIWETCYKPRRTKQNVLC